MGFNSAFKGLILQIIHENLVTFGKYILLRIGIYVTVFSEAW